uniref:Myosin IXAb n=1 Tax=Oncorhynchus tshawytscha TaxID=74940 RepID=A0AAZ3QNA4_ONCTS
MSLQDGGCGYASDNLVANTASGSMRRRLEDQEFTLRIYPGALAEGTIYCPVGARKSTTAAEAIERLLERLSLDRTKCYVLAEVKEFGGEEWILNPSDCPVQRMMLWPRNALENRCGLGSGEDYRFLLREKNLDGSIHYGGSLQMWLRVTEERRRMVERGFLPQPAGGEHPADLCALPELTEHALLESLRSRFRQEKIYTYVGSILIVINPFQFLPIYNPKYVKMYDNHALGDLEPHIYAVADVAYHAMLQRRRNQCIVISGESGSGKTQSTNFLIHHLTALSQKGFASGVEQIILGAGPVLEAFGNAKTAHNDNSSRFGKFIQVNYQESGTVRGAYVEKYLLEKSRLVYQEHNERNYHVFYYLLAGATEEERKAFHLLKPEDYHYLNQITKKSNRFHWENDKESKLDCLTVEGEDLKHDFERLQLAMDMVGFLPATRKQIFSLLSAILYLGNILYKKKTYRDDSIDICNPDVLPTISELLQVKEEMLFEALTTRKTVTVGERLIVPYKLAEAGTVRDSMAKSLYSALFDWIVFRTNHALLNNKDLEHSAKILSIGVLDIFGFEDYENNSFEQFCINLANERLHHYFNQHLFKLEQEEYRAESISWHNIDYIDNTGCINLISKKPTALLHLLDEECNFPQASNQTLLDKFKRQHEGNSYIEFPAVMEPAFIICHYAGKVKYGIKDFREKNTDHMRPDIVALLKSSKNAFICGLMGIDPVATFRWAVLRTYFRAMVAFREAGKRHADKKTVNDAAVPCVVKSVDSFSFLHHPVHQRSLEILQRCKDEKYNITRKNPRTPLSDLQGSNTLKDKPTRYLSHCFMDPYCSFSLLLFHSFSPSPPLSFCHFYLSSRDGYGVGCNGHRSRQGGLSSSGTEFDDGIFFNSTGSKLLERAQSILMRNKNYKSKPSLPKHLLDVKSLRYLSSVTLHDRITKSLLLLHKKKKTPSISAQFQASLNKLMETLGQSEPYFVKCVRSNAEKLPLRFNDALVLRQLRYTGMLETVRIRQSGYAIKYTFQDFVRHFRVLLPDIARPTKSGIREFFRQVHLAPAGYQVGNTMVFLRDAERQRLQALLHKEVLGRIVTLQRRFRARLERKHFINMRQAADVIQVRRCSQEDPAVQEEAAVCLQASWRGYRQCRQFLQWRDSALIIQRRWRNCIQHRALAAITVQTAWRVYRERAHHRSTRGAVMLLQAACRGYMARLRRREGRSDHGESERRQCIDESSRQSIEPSSHKTRAKRQNRRMRELEQTQFSLELLKVRTHRTGGTLPEEETHVPPCPDSISCPLDDHQHHRPSSPDSHGSTSIDVEVEAGGYPGYHVNQSAPLRTTSQEDSVRPGPPIHTPTESQSHEHPEVTSLPFSQAAHKEVQKSIHKTMSSGDLGKVKQLSSQHPCYIFMTVAGSDGTTSPPHSPNLMGTRGRETKENKEPSPKVRRRRSVKISSVTLEPAQWGNDALHILTSTHDYRSMNDFLMKKISDLDSEDCQKDTLVDVVFKKALKEFRLNIFNSYSTALAMDDGKSIRYKDLYALFEHILEKSMRLEQRDWSESPVKVWVNTFKVFLDEFMTEYKPMDGTIIKASKPERKKRRKKESDIVEEHNGHIFKSTQYSIPTYCEYCSSLIWMMDRACVCKLCRYACHRKCCSRMTTKCSKKYDLELSSRQFGVEVSRLTSEERTVPLVVEKLINYIEMHGLYTEGIFRKSGSTNKIKELRQGLDTDVSSMNLDDYNIHVIAGVLKQWLRDLPNPLMTFELYEEFLRAMGQPDQKEVIRGVYSVIDLLSRTHLSTLERLIFHLVRIALQEDTNRMSANALAIVFAPCILRCPDTIDPLQSVQDIGKTTACVELIIGEQMNKYRARLKDINSLEFAENKAKSRLTHIRKSMGKGRLRRGSSHHAPSPPLSPRVLPVVDGESAEEEKAEPGLTEQQQATMQQEERVLTEQIEGLQREKEELTYEMLILEPRASDDETLESEASIGTADSSEKLNMDPEGAQRQQKNCTYHSQKSEAKSRRCLRRQPDSVDSTSSSSSSIIPQSPNYRFRSSSSGPLLSSCSLGLGAPLVESEGDPSSTVGVKSRHRLRLSRSSPREAPEGHRRESDFSSLPQQLVLYGSNEFMV